MNIYFQYIPINLSEIIVAKLNYTDLQNFVVLWAPDDIHKLNSFNIFRYRYPYLYRVIILTRDLGAMNSAIVVWSLYNSYLKSSELSDNIEAYLKTGKFTLGVMRDMANIMKNKDTRGYSSQLMPLLKLELNK